MWKFVVGMVVALAFTGQVRAAAIVEAEAWVVGTYVSEEGETREAFIWRLAALMQAWTDEHSAEVCGYLATDGQRWGVRLTTQRSQIMCIMDNTILPAGFRAEREHIHSHPRANARGKVVINEATREAAKAIGERAAAQNIDIGHGFSGSDRRNGRGYLVTSRRLMHWNGHRERDLGVIPGT